MIHWKKPWFVKTTGKFYASVHHYYYMTVLYTMYQTPRTISLTHILIPQKKWVPDVEVKKGCEQCEKMFDCTVRLNWPMTTDNQWRVTDQRGSANEGNLKQLWRWRTDRLSFLSVTFEKITVGTNNYIIHTIWGLFTSSFHNSIYSNSKASLPLESVTDIICCEELKGCNNQSSIQVPWHQDVYRQ